AVLAVQHAHVVVAHADAMRRSARSHVPQQVADLFGECGKNGQGSRHISCALRPRRSHGAVMALSWELPGTAPPEYRLMYRRIITGAPECRATALPLPALGAEQQHRG